jgi:thiamine pyrophosphokinase
VSASIIKTTQGVTLVGGGRISGRLLDRSLAIAPELLAADAGADRLLALGHEPRAVIGDLDSISSAAKLRLADRLHPIPEQATTDFDKALRSIRAAFALALGFAGGRSDHVLAVMNGLVRHAVAPGGGWPILVLGGRDLIFHAPPGRDLVLRMRRGDRFSLFPLAELGGGSVGLEWPIAGLRFSPCGQIGTSNRVIAPEVRLRLDGPGMLVILPINRLSAALEALVPGFAASPAAHGR